MSLFSSYFRAPIGIPETGLTRFTCFPLQRMDKGSLSRVFHSTRTKGNWFGLTHTCSAPNSISRRSRSRATPSDFLTWANPSFPAVKKLHTTPFLRCFWFRFCGIVIHFPRSPTIQQHGHCLLRPRFSVFVWPLLCG